MTQDSRPTDGAGGDRPGLDPAADPAAWERRVRDIVGAAEPELRRRSRSPAAVGRQIERWAGPVVAAAASVILLGTGLLLLSRGPEARRRALADVGRPGSREVLVSPVVDPWLERDTVTIEAVEEMLTVAGGAGEDRR